MPASDWSAQMGLELYTVRDRMAKDAAGTLAQVAALGYKEVEPDDYSGLDPKAYRALLDKNGLTAPSTHANLYPGPNLEKTLEGFQILGHKYCWVEPPPSPAQASLLHRVMKGGAMPSTPSGMLPLLRAFFPQQTPDEVKRTVALYNQTGAVAKKYGMQILVHNHTYEFQRFPGSEQCPYDIVLAESDPELVVMQLDIGWASVAGEDILAMFQKHPGRFVLWHVKDAMALQYLFPQPEMDEVERMAVANSWLVPVGLGGIDYGTIFQHASTAGMKHFCVEQDNAADWGDSMAAAGRSFTGLKRALAQTQI